MISLLRQISCAANFDFFRTVCFEPLQLDLQYPVIEARLDLIGIDPKGQLDGAGESAVSPLATLTVSCRVFGSRLPPSIRTSSCRLRLTSSAGTPASSAVTTTLFSPSQMLIGGKSRAVAVLNPENTRFISLCIRRSSVKGSKLNRGNSESAMTAPL